MTPQEKNNQPLPPSRTPLWSRLANELAQQIVAGKYPVGSLLPTEFQLMDIYDLSRHTVRTALAELASMGMVKRTPHIGTRVLSDGQNAEYIMEVPSVRDMEPESAHCPRETIGADRLICDENTSAKLGFALQTPLIQVRYMRRDDADSTPWCISRVWMRDAGPDLLPIVSQEEATPLLTLLERHAGVRCANIEQSFTAVGLPFWAASLLKLPEGMPALLQCRKFFDSRGQLLLVAHNLCPSGRYTYTMNVARQ